MDFDVLANLGWREGLIAIIALLVLYVVVVYLRIRRLKRAKAVIPSAGLHAVQSAVAAYAAVQEPESTDITGLPEEPEKKPEFAFPWNEPPSEIPGQPTLEALENEIDQLRKEVGGLRAEILVLREERRQAHELSKPPVTQSISPLYSEAMQKAMQGQDAASISRDCGISRAEAELVAALVKNRDN